MNQYARDTLRAAWLRGQRQIKGMFDDQRGGLCALGVLLFGSTEFVHSMAGTFEIDENRIVTCPLCGIQRKEASCIAHLNDDHDCDFAKIAEIIP